VKLPVTDKQWRKSPNTINHRTFILHWRLYLIPVWDCSGEPVNSEIEDWMRRRITKMSISPAENLAQKGKIFFASLSQLGYHPKELGQPEKCRAKLNGPYYTVKTVKV
jgi:hypothetical protein